MPITNRDRYPDAVFFDESNFLEIGTRSDGARVLQIGKEGDMPIVSFAYTSNPSQENLHAIELWSLMKFSQDNNEYSFHSSPIKLNQNSRVVYKYKIPDQGQFSLKLEMNAEILTVQMQNQRLCLWALLNPSSFKHQRDFIWVCTGEEVHHQCMNYVTTVQLDADRKVIHLFELKPDYSRLENLLLEGEWREADLETFQILGQLCGMDIVPDGKSISQTGTNFVSSSVLQIIDWLWSKYSDGHFGYKAQLSITDELENLRQSEEKSRIDWMNLVNQLGWNTAFPVLNFSLDAPKGHLPAIVGWGMGFGPSCFEEIYRSLWAKFNDLT